MRARAVNVPASAVRRFGRSGGRNFLSALYGLGRGPHHCGGSLGGTEPFIKASRFPRVRVAKNESFLLIWTFPYHECRSKTCIHHSNIFNDFIRTPVQSVLSFCPMFTIGKVLFPLIDCGDKCKCRLGLRGQSTRRSWRLCQRQTAWSYRQICDS